MQNLQRLRMPSLCLRVALLAMILSASPACADEPATGAQSPAAEPGADRPGLLNELGRLFKGPADLLSGSTRPDAAPKPDAVQQAAPTPAPQPVPATVPPVAAPEPPPATATRVFPGMVSGRELCPRSVNGAPDCQAGTDKLCQSKGYKSGKSLNTDSAFTCSVRQARAEGRKPCGTEHYVTSAFCQ